MSDCRNIFYLSNERFPAKLACTIQQVVMCEAFARAGAAVTLLYPHYFDMPSATTAEIQRFYDVAPIFEIQRLPSLLSLSKPLVDGRRRLKIPFIGGYSIYFSTKRFARHLLKSGRLDAPAAIFCRTVNGAQAFLQLKRRSTRAKSVKVIFEVHSLDQQTPRRFFFDVLQKADGLVTVSQAIKKALVQDFSIDPHKILVAPNGVRSRLLQSPSLSRDEARARLKLPDVPLVVYTGQLLPGKGVQVLIEAARFFDSSVQFLIVGGHGKYFEQMRQWVESEKLIHVNMTGFVPPAEIPAYLAAADILILPTVDEHLDSAYTSPLKLFEYMAARRPIISSNLPVLREILRDGENALLFQTGNAEDMAVKIKHLLANSDLSRRLVEQAFTDAQAYTWEARAEKILTFINSLS